MNLIGQTILITGGAAGIGLALAKRLSKDGNQVIICSRNPEGLRAAQRETPELAIRVCDITDTDSRRGMVDWLAAEHPKLSILVNNAGIQHRRDFTSDPDMDSLEQEVRVNLTAPISLIAELLPLLRQQPSPCIMNVSSALAFSPKADIPVYCATKAALHSFTLSLRHQLEPTGVRVVEIAPPIVDTGLGGGTRSDGVTSTMMLPAAAFADEVIAQLQAGKTEVLVGIAEQARQHGEALFGRMNRQVGRAE